MMRSGLAVLSLMLLSQPQSLVCAKIRGASHANNSSIARKRFHEARRELDSVRGQQMENERQLMQSVATGGGAGSKVLSMIETTDQMTRPETGVVATNAPVAPTTSAPVVPATPAPVVPATPAPVVPVTPAPVVPATPAPAVPATPSPVVAVTPAPASSSAGLQIIVTPTFMPTPPPADTGRECPTPDSASWQALANSSPLLQSCDVDSDCVDYFPEEGPACCSWPFCVCATVFPNHESEFMCVNY